MNRDTARRHQITGQPAGSAPPLPSNGRGGGQPSPVPLGHLASFAAAQAGAVSRRQLLTNDVSEGVIRSWIRGGWLSKSTDGVYSLFGYPDTYEHRLWKAILAAGGRAVVSHRAAAALHDLTGFPRDVIELTNPHGEHARVSGAVVHQTRDPFPLPTVELAGLPVTSAARVFVDLAASTSRARLSSVLDDAIRDRRVTELDVAGELARVARPGKPGIRKMGRVLDGRAGIRLPTTTKLERQGLELIRRAGLPEPISQMPFPGRALPGRCVDAGIPELCLVVEIDGRQWHVRIADLKRDHDRDIEAARNGYQVIRLLAEHVFGDPDGSIRALQDIAAARRRLLLADSA